MCFTFYINKKSATTIRNLSKTLLFHYLSTQFSRNRGEENKLKPNLTQSYNAAACCTSVACCKRGKMYLDLPSICSNEEAGLLVFQSEVYPSVFHIFIGVLEYLLLTSKLVRISCCDKCIDDGLLLCGCDQHI